MTKTPKDPVDGTGFGDVGSSTTGIWFTRINPDRPTLDAVDHLRFWGQFNDRQIEQVLGQSPTNIEDGEPPLMTSNTTTDGPATLSESSFFLREFLSEIATDPSVIVAGVDTSESQEGLLMIESTLTLGDGRSFVEFDLSTMVPTTTAEERAAAAESLEDSINKAKALLDLVSEYVATHVDAALEAYTVIESYGDAR